MHSVSKHMRLSEPTTKIWMKMDPQCQRRRCSPTTLVSDNIRFMRIFAMVSWRGATNDCGVVENVDFQGFRTLRLRHLRKWGQHYLLYSIPCRLSTDPQIHDLEWPWMAILVKFSFLRRAVWVIIFTYLPLSLFISRDQLRCAEADRDSHKFWDSWKDCGSFADATSSEPCK